ncbi:hypothetical protein AAJ72_08415 [Citromicrobium sp. RCC1885]|nr:hypothetical protein AAJ72_08415 [Citromicrobium sp. RCC1885]KPM28880.1 hypothetical protein AAJ74_09155 [Citromicrobium sp. RCC1878]
MLGLVRVGIESSTRFARIESEAFRRHRFNTVSFASFVAKEFFYLDVIERKSSIEVNRHSTSPNY